MTIDETEVDKIRFEDLSESLQEMINNLVAYDELDYIRLRINSSIVSNSIDTNTSVYAGDKYPTIISLGRTAYFDTVKNNVKIVDSSGNWIYTQ